MKRYAFAALSVLGLLTGLLRGAEPIDFVPGADQVRFANIPAVDAEPKVEPAPMPGEAGATQSQDQQPRTPGTRPGGLVAGVGVYFIEPEFANNPAFFTTITAPGGTASIHSADFNWDLEMAPRAWIGYVLDSGLGGRARYWRFDHESNTERITNPGLTGVTIIPADSLGVNAAAADLTLFGSTAISPGPLLSGLIPFAPLGADVIAADSDLKLHVVDLEATQQLQSSNLSIIVSAGARYTHLSQSYTLTRSNFSSLAFSDGSGSLEVRDRATLRYGQNFTGWGPTGSIEARLPLLGGLELYGGARGAVLFGRGRQRAHASSTLTVTLLNPDGSVFDTPINETAFADASADREDDVLPVFEAELGGEWTHEFGCTRLFLQAAVVAQTWFDAGNASGEDGHLEFYGLTFTAGVNY